DDVLVLDAAARPHLFEALGAQQGEALGRHAGRGVKLAERDHSPRAVAGLLLKLARRGDLCRLARLLVADQPGRTLAAVAPERHAILLGGQRRSLVAGEDDRGSDAG